MKFVKFTWYLWFVNFGKNAQKARKNAKQILMNNFKYRNPTKILFGKGQIENLATEIPENAKILMLYGGGSIYKNGVYDQVKAALSNFEVLEFGGIPANP